MTKLIWILLALAAGSALPLQGGINARLGKAAASPVYAALISFAVGTAALLVYILVTKQTASWAGIKQLPPQYWIGGILGAIYVSIVILVFPKLGPGLTFSLIVAGQLMLALLLEHYNILVAQQQSVSVGRIMGVVLIVAGVVLMKRF
ncbi:DMT family transporter [Rubripirellula amarantea]|nr:DMT family transporter [Rubripirellula amarantea]